MNLCAAQREIPLAQIDIVTSLFFRRTPVLCNIRTSKAFVSNIKCGVIFYYITQTTPSYVRFEVFTAVTM
jgi:hypothetical protein